MALVIGKKDTRKVRVQIKEQGDFNEEKNHNIDVEYKILTAPDLKEIDLLGQVGTDSYDLDAQVALIFDNIVSVDGLKDEAGNVLTLTPEVKKHLQDTLWIRYAITRGFWSVQHGISQADTYKLAKLKN